MRGDFLCIDIEPYLYVRQSLQLHQGNLQVFLGNHFPPTTRDSFVHPSNISRDHSHEAQACRCLLQLLLLAPLILLAPTTIKKQERVSSKPRPRCSFCTLWYVPSPKACQQWPAIRLHRRHHHHNTHWPWAVDDAVYYLREDVEWASTASLHACSTAWRQRCVVKQQPQQSQENILDLRRESRL